MLAILFILIGLALFVTSAYKLILGKYYDDIDVKLLFVLTMTGLVFLIIGFII